MKAVPAVPAGPDGIVRGYPVETPVGTMYLRHVGWGVLVDNSSNTMPYSDDRPYLTVAGKRFTATVGVRPDGRIERAYVTRVDAPSKPTHHNKIVAAAKAAALAFIAERPEHVAAGEQYHARMNLLHAQADVDRLEPEYQAAVAKLREAREAFNAAERKLKLLDLQ